MGEEQQARFLLRENQRHGCPAPPSRKPTVSFVYGMLHESWPMMSRSAELRGIGETMPPWALAAPTIPRSATERIIIPRHTDEYTQSTVVLLSGLPIATR